MEYEVNIEEDTTIIEKFPSISRGLYIHDFQVSSMTFETKGGVSWDPEWRHDFNEFPAKIWIFKLFFLMVFAIKMLLDNTYGLPNLFEFKSNHFNSLFQAEYEFKNSKFGGKYIYVKISCRFWNWIAFSACGTLGFHFLCWWDFMNVNTKKIGSKRRFLLYTVPLPTTSEIYLVKFFCWQKSW